MSQITRFFETTTAALLLLIIFVIPIQLGYHLWPSYSYIYGVRQDLLSSIIYISDIVILLFLATWSVGLIISPTKIKYSTALILSLLPLSFFISSLFSPDWQLSIYKTAKICQFSLLAFVISQINFEKLKSKILFLTSFSTFWVSVLALIQFFNQQSLNLWMLGERNFSASTPGISLVTLSGQQLLRPYAAFPHPNVLAGFLVLSLIILIFSLAEIKNIFKRLVLIITILIGLSALLLSFSRSAWIAFLIAVGLAAMPVIKSNSLQKKIKLVFLKQPRLSLLIVLATSVILWFALILIFERFSAILTTDGHSLALRQKLLISSLKMFFQSPFIGVGPGRFLVDLPGFFQVQEIIRFFQPVHNIYFLLLSEIGIFGLTSLSVLIGYSFYYATKKNSILNLISFLQLVAIIAIGLFDHYFLTLQQGQLLFFLVIGFCLRES